MMFMMPAVSRRLLAAMLCLCLALGAKGATVVVQAGNYFYFPSNLVINVGDTVIWSNINTAGVVSHDSTSSNGVWASPSLPPGNPGGTFAFTFNNAGSYWYHCQLHQVNHPFQTGLVTVVTGSLPSVSITNPPSGTKYIAPANIPIQASASESGGAISKVELFCGGSLSGTTSNAPYNFTLSNFAAGNYIVTAKATDIQGGAATSAPVTIFVLTNALIKAAARSNGVFQLTISGIAGQDYILEASTNLASWSALVTNTAPTGFFNLTDSTSQTFPRRFYRIRQDLH